ncbi:MAG TPA: transcriptional regulator GcvA [Casimicrobiaceae bacterium]|nr:transcriptional regulator GcvA [Casimicrobiaceae bacterium]
MARRLPPLNSLRAFEAASRHSSFTRAAQELFVTQGAISRHVASLEAWLKVQLFARTPRGIELTPKGAVFFRVVRGALDQLEYGTRQLQQKPDDKTLRLKVPPTFAIRWLVPRLAQFHAFKPDIDVQITTSHQPVNFNREDVDACIHSDSQPLAEARCLRLFGELLLPVCSPSLLSDGATLQSPRVLAKHVLVCSLHRPRDWPTWLGAAGIHDIDGNNGIKVENSALAYQAAIDGLGVVIAQRSFIEDDLRSGRLVAPFALQVPTDGAYYLGYPADRPKSEGVAAFETWIVAEAVKTEERLAELARRRLA